jgi:SAM-dependent methyltransferase
MKHLPLLSVIALLAAIIFLIMRRSEQAEKTEETKAQSTVQEPAIKPENFYTTGPKSDDGFGKFYQGREIAKVMGHPALAWLERPERESEEAPTKAVDLIDLGEADVIADIGAGSGYYSFRLSQKYPKARVIAIDIQEEMLGFLEQKIAQANTQNIITHLGKIQSIDLPPASIDAALMVDSYHEFSHPYEMIHSIVSALRPGGRVFLLEYRAEDPTVAMKPLHKMSQAQAKKEMALVGLEWVKTLDDLPWQHFMVFRKP